MSTEAEAREALAHAEQVAAAAVANAPDGHEGFRLAIELGQAYRAAANRVHGLRAGAALRIRNDEALTLRALADRIGISKSRADQLVREAASRE